MRCWKTETESLRPWIMEQTWHHLLFAHWPVPVAQVTRLIPPGLEVDTFQRRAWVSVVAFRLGRVRLRGLPGLPLVSNFSEINLRTYVRHGDKRGVYFLSLDANNRLAVAIARPWFKLAYHTAQIDVHELERGVSFRARRIQYGAAPFEFAAAYRQASDGARPEAGSLEAWLTNRFCFFAGDTAGQLWRCDIAHAPWHLAQPECTILENSVLRSQGLFAAEAKPILQYARQMRAVFWPLRRLRQIKVADAPHTPELARATLRRQELSAE